ncbi:MAG: porin family protein [Candidatus Acididesulfobacter guangdongensis]|uniref:Porin family protein n=1 Tax=Acididesulfobacter guangdongensis TaxID=2597225 RepID=A0A519BFX1_ACIG2|nr:MAG: porin family protein [Candidatus Acididesulfobacter guangdongensis]
MLVKTKKDLKKIESAALKRYAVSISLLLFALFMFSAKSAFASNIYFNRYYVSLNGGIADTSISGISSKSGGTYNITLGKNFNMNKIVIGGGLLLGYADNGSYSYSYGNASLHSAYYGIFLKGGYAYHNFMPFVKLGYIDYAFVGTSSTGTQCFDIEGDTECDDAQYVSSMSSEGGLMYGAGVEYLFNPAWGLTAQYFGGALSDSDKVNSFTIGIDYNF